MQNRKIDIIVAKTAEKWRKKAKTANRGKPENRKTALIFPENRKTELKKGQNRKTANPLRFVDREIFITI